MSVTDKYIKEIEDIELVEECDIEDKLDFVETQLEAFQKQAYRFQVEVETAKEYIRAGESDGVADADKYIQTGQEKIQEAVGHLRSIKINIAVLCKLRDKLNSQS